MKRLARFVKFVGRFWPLWLVWAVIWAVPVSRDVARRHLVGSIYDSTSEFSLRFLWRDVFGNWERHVSNPLPAMSQHPRDIDLALWDAVWNSDGFYVRGRDTTYAGDLSGVVKKFPDQIIAYAPILQNELGIYAWNNGSRQGQSSGNSIRNARLRDLAKRARQLEPDNALWPVAQAISASRQGDQEGTLKLLQIAARCPVYDDKTLEITRRILKTHERYGALQGYEKRSILKNLRNSDSYAADDTIRFWAKNAAALRRQGKHRKALQWSAALAGVGTLMQRDPNAVATIYSGNNWQQQAWELGFGRQSGKKLSISERFARYAIVQGRADLAATARAQNKQSDATIQLFADAADNGFLNSLEGELWLRAGVLFDYLSLCEIGGFGLILASVYLLCWWLAVNLLLWRARGVPSTRAARVSLALVVASVLLLLGMVSLVWLVFYEQSARGASNVRFEAYENGFISLMAFSFLGAPFVMALAVAAITLWRQRQHFDLSPRVDMELALPNWARALLRWFLPLGVLGTLLFFVGGWTLWITASWNDWGNVDLLALLPPDRNGVTGSWMWNMKNDPMPFIYGIFMCFVCLALWFAKWRWATARHLRPFTHGALRWWKESLGCSIVVLSWAYFAIALIGWPMRNRADARLDRVLTHGDIAVLRQLRAVAKRA